MLCVSIFSMKILTKFLKEMGAGKGTLTLPPFDVFRSHAASLGLQAQILRQGCTRSYVAHVEDFQVACSVMRFKNSGVRQGCTSAYVALLQVVAGRM